MNAFSLKYHTLGATNYTRRTDPRTGWETSSSDAIFVLQKSRKTYEVFICVSLKKMFNGSPFSLSSEEQDIPTATN